MPDDITDIGANGAHELLKGLLDYCEAYGEDPDDLTIADVMSDLESSLAGEVAASVLETLSKRISAL